MLKKLILSLACLGVAGTTVAGEKEIRERLSMMLNNADKVKISKMPIDGLYQVTLDLQVVYMSEDGKYLLNGSVMDLDKKVDLTNEVKTGIVKQELAKLDANSMISYKPKNGQPTRTLTVFTDIDCPYCEKLHNEIPKLNEAGIEVRYMAYPRAGFGSSSYQKTVNVWCADDQKKAMDMAKARKTVAKNTCTNPVLEHMETAKKFEVTGTPTIIMDDGEILPGFVPAAKLIPMLKAG